jgi:hypothetical protein
MNDEKSAQEQKDGHPGQQDEQAARLAGKPGAIGPGGAPSTPLAPPFPPFNQGAADAAAQEALRLQKHDKDVLHDQLCQSLIVHLNQWRGGGGGGGIHL